MSNEAVELSNQQESQEENLNLKTIKFKKKGNDWVIDEHSFMFGGQSHSYKDVETLAFTMSEYEGNVTATLHVYLENGLKYKNVFFRSKDYSFHYDNLKNENADNNIETHQTAAIHFIKNLANHNPEAQFKSGNAFVFALGPIFIIGAIILFFMVAARQGFVIETFTFLGLMVPGLGFLSFKPVKTNVKTYLRHALGGAGASIFTENDLNKLNLQKGNIPLEFFVKVQISIVASSDRNDSTISTMLMLIEKVYGKDYDEEKVSEILQTIDQWADDFEKDLEEQANKLSSYEKHTIILALFALIAGDGKIEDSEKHALSSISDDLKMSEAEFDKALEEGFKVLV